MFKSPTIRFFFAYVYIMTLSSLAMDLVGDPPSETLSVLSWNIQSKDFDSLDQTPNHIHTWATRKPWLFDTLRHLRPDIMGLQEVSPLQAIQCKEELKGYFGLFLPLTKECLDSQQVFDASDLNDWAGRNDVLMNGILWKSADWTLLSKGTALLWEEKRDIPNIFHEPVNRLAAMVKFRGIIHVRLLHLATRKTVSVFATHYPLGTDPEIPQQCATVERAYINSVVGDDLWISMGDRNIFGPKDGTTCIESLDPLLEGAYNAWIEGLGTGPATTWAGFAGDMFDNPLVDGHFKKQLIVDVMVSNHESLYAEHILPEAPEGWLVWNPSSYTDLRKFPTDHFLVKAQYPL